MHTGGFAAQHIGGQTVAQHQALAALYAWQAGKAGVEKAGLWLIGAQVLGDKHPVQQRQNAAAFQPPFLYPAGAVGGQTQGIAPMEGREQLFCSGEKEMAAAQPFHIVAVHFLPIQVAAQVGQQQVKAAVADLRSLNFALLQQLPLGIVASTVQNQNLI